MPSDTPTSQDKFIVKDVDAYLNQRRAHIANRAAFPLDELAKYAGQCVAWDREATNILASAPTYEELGQKLERAGYATSDYVLSWVPEVYPPSNTGEDETRP